MTGNYVEIPIHMGANKPLMAKFPATYNQLAGEFPALYIQDDSALWAHIDERGEAFSHMLVQLILSCLRMQGGRWDTILRDLNKPGCKVHCCFPHLSLEVPDNA